MLCHSPSKNWGDGQLISSGLGEWFFSGEFQLSANIKQLYNSFSGSFSEISFDFIVSQVITIGKLVNSFPNSQF